MYLLGRMRETSSNHVRLFFCGTLLVFFFVPLLPALIIEHRLCLEMRYEVYFKKTPSLISMPDHRGRIQCRKLFIEPARRCSSVSSRDASVPKISLKKINNEFSIISTDSIAVLSHPLVAIRCTNRRIITYEFITLSASF